MASVEVSFARFLDQLPGRSRENLRNYQARLRHFTTAFGPVPVSTISKHQINEWFEQQRRRGLSDVTLNGYAQAMRAFWGWCVAEGLVDRSPAAHLRRTRPRSARVRLPDERSIVAITGLARAWVAAADLLQLRRGALWLLALESGGRLGELANLRLKDVEQALLRPGPAWRFPSRGKTGPVILTVSSEAAGALDAYLTARPSSRFGALWLSTRSPWKPISPSALQDDFAAISRAAGERPVYAHLLRHRVGDLVTRRFGAGVAQQKLNHKQISTTLNFYHHPTDADVAAATEALRPRAAGDDLARAFFGGE